MIKTLRITKEWDSEVVKISEGDHTDYYREPYSDEIQTLLGTLDQYPSVNGIWYLTHDPTVREAINLVEEIMIRPQPEVWEKGQCFIQWGRINQITRVTCRNGQFKSVSVKGLFYPKNTTQRFTWVFSASDLSQGVHPCTLEEAIKVFEFQAKVYDYEWELY